MTREQWRNAIEAIGMISDTDRLVIVETAYSSEAGQLAGSQNQDRTLVYIGDKRPFDL